MNDITLLAKAMCERRLMLAVAESCTGGMVSARVTDVPGSSAWFKGGIVAYHPEVKQALLGVSAKLISDAGIVSENVAMAMAEGVRQALVADVGVGITGFAGPANDEGDMPVGTVCYAIVYRGHELVKTVQLSGNRREVRLSAVEAVISDLLQQFYQVD